MLTEQERKWLEERNNLCKRCTRHSPAVVYCSCGHNFNTNAYSLTPNYRDAAEFAERVARCIAGNAAELEDIAANLQFLDGFNAKSIAWYILREARIAVEQEMDNERNHS